MVWASAGGAFGFSKLSFGKEDTLNLVLDKKGGEAYTLDLDITPPVEGANLPEVTPEQRAEMIFVWLRRILFVMRMLPRC